MEVHVEVPAEVPVEGVCGRCMWRCMWRVSVEGAYGCMWRCMWKVYIGKVHIGKAFGFDAYHILSAWVAIGEGCLACLEFDCTR